MATHSALTEEGRTRIRNFHGRVTSYLMLWSVIGIALVVGAIFAKTRYGYRPLQRLYLTQYLRASIKSQVMTNRSSKYILLIRVIDDKASGRDRLIGCTDDEVIPVRNENGQVIFDPKLGPYFRLRDGIPHKYFYWTSVFQNDAEMYMWLRDHIYDGQSLPGLYWACFLPLPFIVVAGIIVSVKVDLNTNREYEEGNLLRGVRLLKHTEYVRETKDRSGVGLPVFGPERRLR